MPRDPNLSHILSGHVPHAITRRLNRPPLEFSANGDPAGNVSSGSDDEDDHTDLGANQVSSVGTATLVANGPHILILARYSQ
jgi:hypothetical protein